MSCIGSDRQEDGGMTGYFAKIIDRCSSYIDYTAARGIRKSDGAGLVIMGESLN